MYSRFFILCAFIAILNIQPTYQIKKKVVDMDEMEIENIFKEWEVKSPYTYFVVKIINF